MRHFQNIFINHPGTVCASSLVTASSRYVFTSSFRFVLNSRKSSCNSLSLFLFQPTKRYLFCVTSSSLYVSSSYPTEKTRFEPYSEESGYEPPYSSVKTNPLVFMDVVVEGDALGRVFIELFRDLVPKSTEHFRSLCTGERGGCRGGHRNSSNYGDPHRGTRIGPFPESSGCGNSYQGVPFHRIIPGFIVQGGDITTKDGRNNTSLFEYNFPSDFADIQKMKGTSQTTLSPQIEKVYTHVPGTVALAHNNGNPHENGSQFFFNLSHNSHLNDKFLVVGQVVKGWRVISEVARSCGSRCGVPVSRSWILACGQSGGYLEEETNEVLLQSEVEMKAEKALNFFPSF